MLLGFSGFPNILDVYPELNWEGHLMNIGETKSMKGRFESLNVRFVGNWPF